MSKLKKLLTTTLATLMQVLILAPVALAQEVAATNDKDVLKWRFIAGGFGIAVAAFGGALGQGKAAAAALEGISRNPGARQEVFIPFILGLALIESLVIYALVISLILVFP
jgi:F-type H+-transporting ATPase subunit c